MTHIEQPVRTQKWPHRIAEFKNFIATQAHTYLCTFVSAAYLLDRYNLFINAVEYPAVPMHKERFRISIMATHTKEDIDQLAAAIEEVWSNPYVYTD